MLYRRHQPLSTVMKILGLILLIISSAGAEDTRDMEGWGSDDPYNKHYDVRKFEKLRAWAEINGRDVFMGSKIKKGGLLGAESSPDKKRQAVLDHDPRRTGQRKSPKLASAD